MASKHLRGGEKIMQRLSEIAQKMGGGRVKVGFMAGAKYPDGTPVASVAFWNEFGTATTPPRPFFRQMIANESGTWGPKMAKLAAGLKYDGDAVLSMMGEDVKGALQQSINQLTSPELAPATIAAKGFSKPLIDTGHMLNSITYEVEK